MFSLTKKLVIQKLYIKDSTRTKLTKNTFYRIQPDKKAEQNPAISERIRAEIKRLEIGVMASTEIFNDYKCEYYMSSVTPKCKIN